MKTITIMDEALEHLEVLDLLTPCNNCATYYEPDDRDAPRQLCPECQPVALEAPALTREWLEHNIRLALPGLSTARVDRLTDHLYGNLAMIEQAQAQGVKPEPPPTVLCYLCENQITADEWKHNRCPKGPEGIRRPNGEYAARIGRHAISKTQARELGLETDVDPQEFCAIEAEAPQVTCCRCFARINAVEWRNRGGCDTGRGHAITEAQARELGAVEEA